MSHRHLGQVSEMQGLERQGQPKESDGQTGRRVRRLPDTGEQWGHRRETEEQFSGGAGNCSRTTERGVIHPALSDRCSFCSISPSPQGGDRTGSLHNYLGN